MKGGLMAGIRADSSRRSPSSWLRSLARLCRPLPALLLRLLLGLPGRWLQLLALAWGALLGRDRLLLQAKEEEAQWQEVLKALSGGQLHPQGLYLGKESLLWEPGLLGGVKGMPPDTLGGLPAGLLEGLPAGLLEGLPAEVINHHLKMLSADEGQLNISNFPGFGMVSCVLGQQWAEYEDCGKESGSYSLYSPECLDDICKHPGDGGYRPWQYPATDLYADCCKTTAHNGTGSSDHFRKRTEHSCFDSTGTNTPEFASSGKEHHKSFTKRTDPPDTRSKTVPLNFNTERTVTVDSLTKKTEDPVTLSKGADANFKTTEPSGDGAISIPHVRICPSESHPPVLPEQPLPLCQAQASAVGPGSLAAQCEGTKRELPELQLIRTKRLDFLGQVTKAYLLPTPDQDHGYCSLEENLLLYPDQDTPSSCEGSFPLQYESAQVTGCMANKFPCPLDYSKESHACQEPKHNTPVIEYSISWQEDPHTALYENPFPCLQASDDTGSPLLPPDIPSYFSIDDKVDIHTDLQTRVTDMGRSFQEKLMGTHQPSIESIILNTHLADGNVGGVDSDTEEDLPVLARPVCNNKLIDYILGAVGSDEEGGSSGSEGDWDEEEGDDGFDSEGSVSVLDDYEDQLLWKSFSSQDPYHPHNFTAPIETSLKIKEEQVVGDNDLLVNSDSEEESSWGEGPPGSASTTTSDEDDDADDHSEDSMDEAENLKLWNSFNNSDDPYNPLCFKAHVQTVISTKSMVGSADLHYKLGTVSSHCCISLPHQELLGEISGVGFCAVLSNKDSRGSRRISKQKKVTFLDQVTEYCVGNEDRKGQWEEYARDRCRFQKRIQETEQSIGHCFTPIHRQRLWDRMQETPFS